MHRHDGTGSNIFRPNLIEVHSGLWNPHVYSTSVCLLEILIGFMHVLSYLFLCFESRRTLGFVSCPPNHLEGEFWMTDCSAKWVWLFNDNAVITEAISLDLLRVIHIQTIFMTLYVQIDNLIIIHLSSPVNASLVLNRQTGNWKCYKVLPCRSEIIFFQSRTTVFYCYKGPWFIAQP